MDHVGQTWSTSGILNSDATTYGGAGIGNRGGMHTDAQPCHGHARSLVLTIPPLGIVMVAADESASM